MGDAEYILGIQIRRRSDGNIFLPQRAYFNVVLARYKHTDHRPATTPMVPNLQLRAFPKDCVALPELR
jgi:hypothetical protein